LLTDQNGMSKSHRGPSIDASYQVSVYLAKLCQSRFLEIDQSEKKNWTRFAVLNGYERFSSKYKHEYIISRLLTCDWLTKWLFYGTFNGGANIYQISNKHVQSHKLTVKKYNPKSCFYFSCLWPFFYLYLGGLAIVFDRN
jgi:hypothetical protein